MEKGKPTYEELWNMKAYHLVKTLNLQAAATDLLEALKAASKVLENLTGEGHINNVKVQVREAIAKAEGNACNNPSRD